MLKQLVDFLFGDLFLWVLTIFSTFFAVYTWIKGKERKELTYSYTSNAIIRGGEKQNPAIKVEYNGIEVNDLTSTKIAIWNSGNKVLNKSDMVVEKELTISVDEGKRILAVEIITQSDETNKFVLTYATENTQSISFDYVDVQEGAVLQVFHDGYNDAIRVDGKIKGGKPIKWNNYNQKELRKTTNDRLGKYISLAAIFPCVILVVMTIFTLSLIWIPSFGEWVKANQQTPSIYENIFMTVFVVLANCVVLPMTVYMVQREYHLSVPTKLRKYM